MSTTVCFNGNYHRLQFQMKCHWQSSHKRIGHSMSYVMEDKTHAYPSWNKSKYHLEVTNISQFHQQCRQNDHEQQQSERSEEEACFVILSNSSHSLKATHHQKSGGLKKQCIKYSWSPHWGTLIVHSVLLWLASTPYEIMHI